MQRVDRKTGIVMKIAKQCNREAIQALRPACQGKIPAHNVRPVRLRSNTESPAIATAPAAAALKINRRLVM